jgi:hypothetical protein
MTQADAGLVQDLADRHFHAFQMRKQARPFGFGKGSEQLVLYRIDRGEHLLSPVAKHNVRIVSSARAWHGASDRKVRAAVCSSFKPMVISDSFTLHRAGFGTSVGAQSRVAHVPAARRISHEPGRVSRRNVHDRPEKSKKVAAVRRPDLPDCIFAPTRAAIRVC